MTDMNSPGEIAAESAGAAFGGLVAVWAGMAGADLAAAAAVGGAVGPWTGAWLRLSATDFGAEDQWSPKRQR